MPNAKTHFAVGCAVGATIDLCMQWQSMAKDPDRPFDWGELIACTAVSGCAAMLPDILEPASSPNHRAFFHSLAAAAIVAYVIAGQHTKRLSKVELLLLSMAGFGYLSHLAADATTPKSINLF